MLINDLFNILIDILNNVPYGVVVFFPSYAYLDFILQKWKFDSPELFQQLSNIKPIYTDTRSEHNAINIWTEYSIHSTSSIRGACLFSVMGGKLSEGINFSDNLARAVVIIGMLYSDRNDPILNEKLNSMEKIYPGGSKYFYNTLCMKTVNQSIGRSIRHIGDYASIILVDIRYSQQNIIELLPNWVSQVLIIQRFNRLITSLQQFFFSF